MTSVRKEISARASRETVWRHFVDPDLLAAWLARNNFSQQVGAPFEFRTRSTKDWDGVIHCRLVELEPAGTIAFTWDAEGNEGDTLVTIELSETGEGTRISLIHSNIKSADNDGRDITQGYDEYWTDHLDLLARQIGQEESDERQAPVPIDWAMFDLYVSIRAEPENVLSSWSTCDGMEGFFVEMMRITGPDGRERASHERAQPGDRYIWRWPTGRYVRGEYLENATEDEVRFTFGDSKVCVTSKPYRKGTLLRLRQFDIPDNDHARMHIHVNCRAAWVYFLSVLKTVLEQGIDGRDMTRETGASFSTYFDPAVVGIDF